MQPPQTGLVRAVSSAAADGQDQEGEPRCRQLSVDSGIVSFHGRSRAMESDAVFVEERWNRAVLISTLEDVDNGTPVQRWLLQLNSGFWSVPLLNDRRPRHGPEEAVPVPRDP
jgi:hypothetical protein